MYPAGAAGVPVAIIEQTEALHAPDGSETVMTSAARVAVPLLVKIGVVAKAFAALLVGAKVTVGNPEHPVPVSAAGEGGKTV